MDDSIGRGQSFLDALAMPVERPVANATAPARGEHQPGNDDALAVDSDGNGWPDPHPLAAKIEPEAVAALCRLSFGRG